MSGSFLDRRFGALASRVSWATLAQVGKVAIQFGSIAIMTRLLPVSDFGLLAMAALFTTFAMLLQDMGTSAALIQRKELTQELVNTVFWLNVFVGIGLCAILIAISPLAALAFAEPRLQSVLIALSAVFPASSVGTVPLALLQRNGRLRRLCLIELSAASLGLAAGVAAAINGLGVYSLVIQQAVGSGLQVGMLWLSSDVRPQRRWSLDEMRRIWAFTGHLVTFNTVNYFARNADNMLIGRFLGAADLALYSMAYRFITAPLQFLGSVSNRVLLPLYSERQDQPSTIGTHFIKTLSLIALGTGPAMALLWGLRQPVVAILLGDNWLRVVDVLSWFGPVGYVQAIGANVGVVLISLGKTRMLRNLGFINTAVYLVVFFASVRFGIVGVATGYFFATSTIAITTLHVTLKLVQQSLLSLLRAIWKQTIFSVAIGIATWLPIDLGWLDGFSPLIQLLILVPAGAALYFVLLVVFARELVRPFLKARIA
ncbi:lipopolysaccharide biosynthesis protein [Dongia sp. agr-C8]